MFGVFNFRFINLINRFNKNFTVLYCFYSKARLYLFSSRATYINEEVVIKPMFIFLAILHLPLTIYFLLLYVALHHFITLN